MRQAFIIMQIGNPQLDSVYKDIIVPAVTANHLEAKRVDKHNEGGLLKSEIISFLRDSDLIIADLTNERPNCYLEVGYAMGQDKYSNLILSAREDHNPDSPNHKTGGPKVHFDLAGYDILWWQPDKLDDFRTELEKRIRRRLKIVSDLKSTPASAFNEEWIGKIKNEAFSGFQENGQVSFMEVKAAIVDSKTMVSQKALISLADSIQSPHLGWPIAFVKQDIVVPTAEGIKSKIAWRQYYDFWALNKDGTFYLLRKLWENETAKPVVMYDMRIKQTTELLLYFTRLYKGLGVSQDDPIAVSTKYGGLKGYQLLKSPSDSLDWEVITAMASFKNNACQEPEVEISVITTIRELETNITDIVDKLTKPLFIMFQFFEVPKETLDRIVGDFLKQIKP